MGAGAIIILLGGLGVLGLALSPLLWTRDPTDNYRLKQVRSAALLAILFAVLAVAHHLATQEKPRPNGLTVVDVDF